MESWRKVWRDGIAPGLTVMALEALLQALREDDPRLLQGATSSPPPLACVQDWPCEGGCVIGFSGWQGNGLATVGEVEEFFAMTCYDSDQRTGSPADCRYFLNWADDTPRDRMRQELIPEVELAIASRSDTSHMVAVA